MAARSSKSLDCLTSHELCDFLINKKVLDENQTEEILEREIDGAAFVALSREDIASIYPEKKQFLLVSRLYREILLFRQAPSSLSSSSLESDADISSLSDITSVSQTAVQKATSKRSFGSDSIPGAKRNCHSKNIMESFSLPKFPPDVAKAIKNDAFHTTAVRNKLIRESCRALNGHCQQYRPNSSPTNKDKRELGTMLYKLAPKSLGDPEGLAVAGVPEATLNRQIIKWFQNNTFNNRKILGVVTKRVKGSASQCNQSQVDLFSEEECEQEDVLTVPDDVTELELELKKAKTDWDNDKIAQLLSSTYKFRDMSCLKEKSTHLRISKTVSMYPCFKQPIFILQELFHKCETDANIKFADIPEVLDAFKSVQQKWLTILMPSIVALVEESTLYETQSDFHLVDEIDCLQLVVQRLKPRSSSVPTAHRMEQIVCINDSLDVCRKQHPSNDPYIALLGTMEHMLACYLLCDNKVVIRLPIGVNLASMLLVLIGFCHLYNVKYASDVQDVMEFFQSSLLGLKERSKGGIQYNNFIREMRRQQEIVEDACAGDDDDTQLDHEGFVTDQIQLMDPGQE